MMMLRWYVCRLSVAAMSIATSVPASVLSSVVLRYLHVINGFSGLVDGDTSEYTTGEQAACTGHPYLPAA